MLKILVNVTNDDMVADATFGTGYGFYIQLDVDDCGTWLLATLKNDRCENWIGTDWLKGVAYPTVTWGADQIQYAVDRLSSNELLEHAYKFLLNEQGKGNLDDPRFRA
jgi:hypothetical protein